MAGGRALRRVRPRRPALSGSTRSPARCSSGPAVRARRRRAAALRRGASRAASPDADVVPQSAAAGAATWRPGRCGCSRRASPTSPGSRTGRRPWAGSDAETLEEAKVRGPLLLRSRGRAVTAEDFVQLTHDVAPEAARVHCSPTQQGDGGEGMLVLVVPHVVGRRGGSGAPCGPRAGRERCCDRISDALDERRLVGTRLLVAPPVYVGSDRGGGRAPRERFDADEVRDDVLRAVYGLLDPLTGGPDGTGWPFGRSVQSHEVHAALSRISGVDMAQEITVTLFPADADTGRRGSRCSGWTCRATGWSSPTSTRYGCDESSPRRGPAHTAPAGSHVAGALPR